MFDFQLIILELQTLVIGLNLGKQCHEACENGLAYIPPC